ncbi:MAG: prepilin-type N-terminal cleavage/methylation domain-containing protein [Bacilli bacterium]|nr:prepilin-type N-terminal cleavage/methylation domain-containing protein [Bacilli bacterium]MDD4298990.1 prepilin-type N-terminal cleavage/methylation domain-containing protein [Bacilli bacterium]MDD4644050.1 prepilin-type N-terminal cleavage/methylation domain-containing protein [Bacilli bacterium]
MKNKSFTLIELLVVIVIIGILASVIIVSVSSSIDKANFAKAQAFSSTLQNSMLSDISYGYSFDDIIGVVDEPLPNETVVDNDWGSISLNVENGPILKSRDDCFSGKCIDFINDSATNLNRLYVNSNFDFSSSNFTISYWVNLRGGCRYTGGVYSNRDLSTAGIMEILDPSSNALSIYQGVVYNDKIELGLYFTDLSKDYLAIEANKNMYNNWRLITFSYNDDTDYLKLYIDGEIVYNSQVGLGKDLRRSSNTKFSIGKYTTYWMKGIIDDFKIYKKEISISEVKEEYFSGIRNLLESGSISKEEYEQRLNNLAYKK